LGAVRPLEVDERIDSLLDLPIGIGERVLSLSHFGVGRKDQSESHANQREHLWSFSFESYYFHHYERLPPLGIFGATYLMNQNNRIGKPPVEKRCRAHRSGIAIWNEG
jgi:hypothetical protein